jgi:phospholipase/carboxylesterase
MPAAYRALRHMPRALEALYPLAGLFAPVNRFFLDPARRDDEALQRRTLVPSPDNTGLMAFGDASDSRQVVWVYVPETAAPEGGHPLIMALHGGGGRGRGFLWSWLRDARTRGAILVAPTSLGPTWALTDDDHDTPHLAQILDFVRSQWPVDPTRVLLTGMSDGGTFAYVSGLQPESPFTHLAPVSAAFHPMLAEMADGARLRRLPIHIVHGALDWMFPVDMARGAASTLQAAGADVTYREVADLSHVYPVELNGAILDWMDATPGKAGLAQF